MTDTTMNSTDTKPQPNLTRARPLGRRQAEAIRNAPFGGDYGWGIYMMDKAFELLWLAWVLDGPKSIEYHSAKKELEEIVFALEAYIIREWNELAPSERAEFGSFQKFHRTYETPGVLDPEDDPAWWWNELLGRFGLPDDYQNASWPSAPGSGGPPNSTICS